MPVPELIPAFDLRTAVANTANPRTIDDAGRAALRAKLERHGNVGTIVVRRLPDGQHRIISGHQRAELLLSLGQPHQPTFVVECDDADEKALLLALNGHDGEWDAKQLDTMLRELHAAGEDLTVLAIDSRAYDKLIKELADASKSDDPPPANDPAAGDDKDDTDPTRGAPAADPVTRSGDVWQLGRHRITCGDSRMPETVARVTQGAEVPLMVSDPPYCSGGNQEAQRSAGTWGNIAADNLSSRGFVTLMKDVLAAATPRAVYLFTDWRQWMNVHDLAEGAGLAARTMIVWDKGNPGMAGLWRPQHELVLFATRDANKRTKGVAGGANVIRCNRQRNELHYTQKPVDLITAILRGDAASERGACAVLDSFLGSGTTLMACEAAGRTCYGIEVEPGYVDVVVQRWQETTGQVATLDGTASTFAEVAAQRGKILPAKATP